MEATGPADLEALDRAEAELEDVERALVRLDEGSYGNCEACGSPIGMERLAETPLTRRCAQHDQQVGPSYHAPAEN